METVIRSPQDGVVKKLAHKEGVSEECWVVENNHGLTWFRISARREQSWFYLRKKLAKKSHDRYQPAFAI